MIKIWEIICAIIQMQSFLMMLLYCRQLNFYICKVVCVSWIHFWCDLFFFGATLLRVAQSTFLMIKATDSFFFVFEFMNEISHNSYDYGPFSMIELDYYIPFIELVTNLSSSRSKIDPLLKLFWQLVTPYEERTYKAME